LRFFAFKNDFTSYRHDVADFLTDYMESVSDPGMAVDFDYAEERDVFYKTFRVLRLIAENLGIDSRIFGTVVGPSADPRGQFSVYHYEGLVLGLQAVLGQVDASNVDHIAALASVVSTGKADQAFLTHTGAGKNQRGSLFERMNYFARRFEAALA
jgi:hypothetical protein